MNAANRGNSGHSQKLNKEEATPPPFYFSPPFALPFLLPSPPFSSLPFRSRTPPPIAASGSRGISGALKLPQRVRANPGRRSAVENASSDNIFGSFV